MKKILLFFLLILTISSCDCIDCNKESTDGEVIALLKRTENCRYIYFLIETDDYITVRSYDIYRYGVIKDNRNYLDKEGLHLNKEMIDQIKTLTDYGRN